MAGTREAGRGLWRIARVWSVLSIGFLLWVQVSILITERGRPQVVVAHILFAVAWLGLLLCWSRRLLGPGSIAAGVAFVGILILARLESGGFDILGLWAVLLLGAPAVLHLCGWVMGLMQRARDA